MREFSEFEKNIIKKMVAAKEIRELSLAKLIDENISSIALEWSIDPARFTVFYRSSVGTESEIYFQIQEIIFLLKNLEDQKFIYLHHRQDSKQDNRLYNHTKYGRNETTGEYYFLMDNEAKGMITDWVKPEFDTDFGSYVQHYVSGFCFVSNALRDLEKNNFKSPEQLRFEHQLDDANKKHAEAMGKAQDQVKYSQRAFYCSIAAFFFALLFGIIQMCSETTLDKNQLNQIKQTIEQTTIPDVIKTQIVNDTLTTKVVEMPKTQKTP